MLDLLLAVGPLECKETFARLAITMVPVVLDPLVIQHPDLQELVCTLIYRTNMSVVGLLSSLQYMDRIKTIDPGYFESFGTGYTVFSTCAMMASKYLEDHSLTNQSWAFLLGIDNQELNFLERKFLTLINFDLAITDADIQRWIATVGDFIK